MTFLRRGALCCCSQWELVFARHCPGEAGRSLTQEEHADHVLAAKNMSRMWASFARTSQPAAPGQPFWPAYDLDRRATMIIAARCHVANDPYPAEREVWAEIGSISTQQNVSSS